VQVIAPSLQVPLAGCFGNRFPTRKLLDAAPRLAVRFGDTV
jgi:hypothetical protein